MRLVPSRPMSPFPLRSEVIWLWFVPGAFPSVTLRACGPFTQSGLCGIARAILHSSLRCITSFLPSFLVCTEHFLSSPHSCLLTLPTVNFASVPFPLSVSPLRLLLYFVMLKTSREVAGNPVYFPFGSVLLPCPLILSLPPLPLFSLGGFNFRPGHLSCLLPIPPLPTTCDPVSCRGLQG